MHHRFQQRRHCIESPIFHVSQGLLQFFCCSVSVLCGRFAIVDLSEIPNPLMLMCYDRLGGSSSMYVTQKYCTEGAVLQSETAVPENAARDHPHLKLG